jgi:KaiC/GvpD/RAD55 family RecA-like ATPase
MPKEIITELRTALTGRSSVFVGSLETPTERIVYHMIYETILAGQTVIWICLRDTPNTIFDKFSSYELPVTGSKNGLWFVDATITGDRNITPQTTRCASMDYASMIMEAGKLMKKLPGSLVMLDNLGILAALYRADVIVRPLKYLDTKIRAEGGGFVTMLANKAVPGSVEAELLGLIDIIIHVGEDNIHALVGSKELSIPFSFTGSELIPGNMDMDRYLKELFSITPEEKKKLELEVEEKAHLYGEPAE